jgi:hypothetical protein
MKTVLSVLCCFVIIFTLSGCSDGDDGGSSGGPGRWPSVSFTVDNSDNVKCWNADSNVITTRQICIWNCAYYESSIPRYVKLEFDEAPVCVPTGEFDEEGDPILDCNVEVALVSESFQSCRLDNPPPY